MREPASLSDRQLLALHDDLCSAEVDPSIEHDAHLQIEISRRLSSVEGQLDRRGAMEY